MSTAAATPREFLARTVVGWHVAFVSIVTLVTLFTVVDDKVSPRDRLLGVVLGGLMLTSYGLLGRRLIGAERAGPTAFGYLASVWVPFLVLVRVTDAAYLLLFILFPQTWAILPKRAAVAVNVAVCVALAVTGLADGSPSDEVVTTAGFNLVLSLLLGLWITGIIDESERRRDLIADLRRTRDELATTERARGVLAERQRLAHEIHDTLAQGLTSIIALAQAIEATIDRDPRAARERLALLEATARADLDEARALVADLGPADLRSGSLSEAVRRLVDRVGRELGVPAELTVEGEPRPLPAGVEVVLLRSTQEALANVRKHAGARRIRVRLAYEGVGATLEVCDDGRGFDPDGPQGFGLPGMRRRVGELGGRLHVDSATGAGTRLLVWVP